MPANPWKAKATETQTRAQELCAYTRIQSHRVRHFLHIRADFLAQVGNHIGITDLQRQERVGGMFDQLGAIDCGDEQVYCISRRARPIVYGTSKRAFHDWAVDLTHVACEFSSSTPTTIRSG